MTSTSRLVAACFALAAFTVAIVAGLAGGNPATDVLGRAVISMLVCHPVGFGVGIVCDRVIAAHVQAHEAAHPAPDSNDVEVVEDAGAEEAIVV